MQSRPNSSDLPGTPRGASGVVPPERVDDLAATNAATLLRLYQQARRETIALSVENRRLRERLWLATAAAACWMILAIILAAVMIVGFAVGFAIDVILETIWSHFA